MEEKTASSLSRSSPKIEKIVPRDETDEEICAGASSAPMLPENISNLNKSDLSSFFWKHRKVEENQIQPESILQLCPYPLDPHGFSHLPQFLPPVGFESHQFFQGNPESFNPSTEEDRMNIEIAEEQFKRENIDYVVNRLAEFDINMAIEIKKGYLKNLNLQI